MKKYIVAMIMSFLLICPMVAQAEVIIMKQVDVVGNISLEVDINNVQFHKIEDKYGIFFTAAEIYKESKDIRITKIYAMPEEQKFKILEMLMIDGSSGEKLTRDITPSDWKTYSSSSPVQKCVNYILNNYESNREQQN